MAVWGGLTNSSERTGSEKQRRKERYKHLNAEFQRIARRDKKAFLSYQLEETEENNRRGNTRDLFKKIRDTKGTFHAKIGSIKDRNCTDVISSVQFSSVTQSCPTLCDPMNRSKSGFPVHHHLLEFTQTHVYQVHDAIQPSHPRSSPSPPALNPSQHQSLFQWVNSLHEVAKVLEFQL